jgi:hypothetical protein
LRDRWLKQLSIREPATHHGVHQRSGHRPHESVPPTEIADRERQTHLRHLAEALAAEVDDRTA